MGSGHALGEETRDALGQWAKASGCELLVLFGSAASEGSPRVDGDVDLALMFAGRPPPERRLAMIGDLQDLLGRARVDVVFLGLDTDPVLRFEIFRGGVPVYEDRDGLFVDEVVRALALYEDALPFRRRLRESLIRRDAPA